MGHKMRVFIVDDEILVRASLRTSFNWQEEGFEIIGEAEDGQEAIGKIERLQPNILLLDIKMPIKSGIDVLEFIEEKDFKIKTIILSCHDDYDYVREALKKGAFDYLLKHKASSEDILAMLKNAREQIIKDQKQNQVLDQQIKSNKKYVKEEFMKQLIDGVKIFDWEIDKYIKSCDLKIKRESMSIIIFKVDHYDKVKERYDSYNKHLLEFSIGNICDELTRSDKVEYLHYTTNEFIILYGHNKKTSELAIYKDVLALANRLNRSFYNYLNVNTYFGVSSIFNQYKNMNIAYQQAKNMLDYKYIYTEELLFHPMAYGDKNKIFQTKMYEQELLKACKDKEFTKIINLSLDFIQDIRKEGVFIPTCDLINIYQKVIEELSKDLSKVSEIMNCSSIDDLHDFVIKLCNQLQQEEQSTNYLVRQALNFIRNNYSQPLSLNVIADNVNVNECYLSRLFHKEMGISLMAYVKNYRVNKAKVMLKNTTLKNYEIAEKVGYKTSVHFNMVFKKVVGLTPVEFRNQ